MRYLFGLFLISLFFVHCSDKTQNMKEINVMDTTLKNDLQTIANAKIFFGHQSVGYNIVEGLQELNTQAGTVLNILETNEAVHLPASYFAHVKNGLNEQPKSKCDAFAQALKTDFADSLDIAFFKFCYIDINSETDIQDMFDYYKKTIDEIKVKNPNIKIMHVTAPLRLVQSGWKAAIKKMLGKTLGGAEENVKRNQFNALLLAEYKDEPVFDLAKVESTYPDGSRQSFIKDGKTYYAMVAAYTPDRGHLNALGAKLAAKELVRVLASILTSP